MKRFFLYILLFAIPVALVMATLEVIVHKIPNNYSYKYNYIKEKGNTIKTLGIGHSQMVDGFQPKYYSEASFNLSQVAQQYDVNYYLLRNLIDQMPNLRRVIMPIGYLNVVDSMQSYSEINERGCYYHEYMNVDFDGRLPIQYYYECFNPYRAIKKIVSFYGTKRVIRTCDDLGTEKATMHSLPETKDKLYGFTLKPSVTSFKIDYSDFFGKNLYLVEC